MAKKQTIKVEKTCDFSIMDNTHLNDTRLSWEAKGLLSFMLSVPSVCDFPVEELVRYSPGGQEEVENILHELESFGYLYRQQEQPMGN